MQGAGKAGLCQSHWRKELREKDLAGMGCDAKFGQHSGDSSMIISAANFFTFAVREFEYESILLVHADTVKASAIPPQLLQSIGGRHPQIFDGRTCIQQIEFLLQPTPQLASNAAGSFAVAPVVDVGSRRIPEAGDHKDNIPEYPAFMDGNGKRGTHVRSSSHCRPTSPRA